MHYAEGHGQAGLERSGTTVTWDPARKSTAPVADPVQVIKLLPFGPLFVLDTYRWLGRPRKRISVGADPRRDIVLDEPTVSALHCCLCRKRATGRLSVSDEESKNGVYVNNVRVFEGRVELTSGALLSLGGALLLACGKAGDDQRPTVSGSTLHEILERAAAIYGSQRKAAQALRIKQATYSRWLAGDKFR